VSVMYIDREKRTKARTITLRLLGTWVNLIVLSTSSTLLHLYLPSSEPIHTYYQLSWCLGTLVGRRRVLPSSSQCGTCIPQTTPSYQGPLLVPSWARFLADIPPGSDPALHTTLANASGEEAGPGQEVPPGDSGSGAQRPGGDCQVAGGGFDPG
jgi:hypothetical protein